MTSTTEDIRTEKGMFKRDFLVDIERKMQSKWKEEKLFEQDAGEEGDKEKFMVTFTYPYMNGRLHLGHCFAVSKAEFAASYQRLCGKKVLFPFGFHCTGMPIMAAAGKLKDEIGKFGNPPVFPTDENSLASQAKHSKVAVKTGGIKYQWNLMESLGIPAEEVPKFVDPVYWTKYFPPLCKKDIDSLGGSVDWRRSFITTDANPFQDAFVRWQFNKLYKQGRIKYGKRYTIYSTIDNQPCLDHDRASGEGVNPKEFTCIKIKVLEPQRLELTGSVYLVAATLRPETMYGQTNCWVGPEVTYGVFKVSSSEYLICTERSARNMAYQSVFPTFGNYEMVKTLKGVDLIGLKLSGPLSILPHFYVLPMMSVSAFIGTGIVTSVPSSSPDDFATLRDLKDKEPLRAKFGIKDEWVLPFDPIAVCQAEAFSSQGLSAAEFACKTLGIRSQNDRDLLDKAKELVYKEEFYSGKMVVGDFANVSVQEAKPKIQAQLVATKEAFIYYEPEKKVMSRSGDECVVALCDQWFLGYGEPSWREDCRRCLAQMEVFSPEVRNQFEQTLNWMEQWACSRTFGLGSKLPWDSKWIIESLSDSTIYMAYYTVSHILHEGSFDGSISPNGIRPEQMTDEVWDYIFGEDSVPFPSESGISSQLIDKMRGEFRFFYPMDLRVSGKDLIPNHLTMAIYNHVAIFPERFWPKAFHANGHLLLNSEKMSKSTGNFMTMHDAIATYGADATRIALADAGDGVEDANFVKETADKAILRMYSSIEQVREFFSQPGSYREGDFLTIDRVFMAEVEKSVVEAQKAYHGMEYREALKLAFFDLQNTRDFYRDVCVVHGSLKMHREALLAFFELQCRIMAPITPHFSDYVWRELLNKQGSVLNSGYPGIRDPSAKHLAIGLYLRKTAHELRLAMINDKSAKDAKNGEIYVALKFPLWQEQAIKILKENWNGSEFGLADDKLVSLIREGVDGKPHKKLISFSMELRKKCLECKSISPLERQLEFEESSVLDEHAEYLKLTFGLEHLLITKLGDELANAKMEAALPGQPTIRFY